MQASLLRSLLFGANVQCNWSVQPTISVIDSNVDRSLSFPAASTPVGCICGLSGIANDLRVMILNVLFYFILLTVITVNPTLPSC